MVRTQTKTTALLSVETLPTKLT